MRTDLGHAVLRGFPYSVHARRRTTFRYRPMRRICGLRRSSLAGCEHRLRPRYVLRDGGYRQIQDGSSSIPYSSPPSRLPLSLNGVQPENRVCRILRRYNEEPDKNGSGVFWDRFESAQTKYRVLDRVPLYFSLLVSVGNAIV